ncbi:MAG: hypothetical protein NC122_00250 [Faecalibacterium sp.]|nr:hypothetical protein [Ruminococcus flavefaciens]MCM1363236.1 hypothetical protein [Clostridiales bacterium]MCM1484621.1 hypothetical protein [Faecalibacterium sp.]
MSYKITSKKVLSFIMAVLIALSMLFVQVGAVDADETQEEIQNVNIGTVSPQWDNVRSSYLKLDLSKKTISLRVNVQSANSAKYKNGTVTISKYSGGKYVTVKKWTGLSSSSSIFLFSNSELSATSGVKYKLSVSITAYTSSKSEVVSLSKVATCP